MTFALDRDSPWQWLPGSPVEGQCSETLVVRHRCLGQPTHHDVGIPDPVGDELDSVQMVLASAVLTRSAPFPDAVDVTNEMLLNVRTCLLSEHSAACEE